MSLERILHGTIGPSTTVVPSEPKMGGGGLKLEMMEKYNGSQEPIVARLLTKMERYFKLMNNPTDLWVEVIAKISQKPPSLVG